MRRGGPGRHREWLSLLHHVRRCHLMAKLHVRPTGAWCALFFFFTAASEQSRVCPAAVTHHSQEATVGCNDVIGQETPWLTERFIYSDLNYSIDLIVSSFELFERPFRSVAVGLTCSVAYTHRLWQYVNIFLTFAAFIHPI